MNYCQHETKKWVVSYGDGRICVPKLICDSKARDRFPELKFEYKDKVFSVQFHNITDWIAARDSSKEVKVHILSGSRKNRVEGLIRHIEISKR